MFVLNGHVVVVPSDAKLVYSAVVYEAHLPPSQSKPQGTHLIVLRPNMCCLNWLRIT